MTNDIKTAIISEITKKVELATSNPHSESEALFKAYLNSTYGKAKEFVDTIPFTNEQLSEIDVTDWVSFLELMPPSQKFGELIGAFKYKMKSDELAVRYGIQPPTHGSAYTYFSSIMSEFSKLNNVELEIRRKNYRRCIFTSF